jgi:hypothetical protein
MFILPMMSFGYAHWTDKVRKQVKLHAGTVEVDIPWWHVDELRTTDVDCDDDVFSVDPEEPEEFHIIPVFMDDQLKEIRILADPIFPGWYVEFKFFIHNKGRLKVRSYNHRVEWIMGSEPLEDPCWLDLPWDQPFPGEEVANVIPGIIYDEELYLHDPATPCIDKPCLNPEHYTLSVSPTTYTLKPCECVLVKEFINADIQEYPEYQCHYFRLTKELEFVQADYQVYSSFGWVKALP